MQRRTKIAPAVLVTILVLLATQDAAVAAVAELVMILAALVLELLGVFICAGGGGGSSAVISDTSCNHCCRLQVPDGGVQVAAPRLALLSAARGPTVPGL